MGSKTSNVPAPDPRLVEAQLKSMGIQDDAIQRIMDNSEDMMPLQKEQMQFGLDTSKAAWEQSQDDRAWAMGRRDKLTGLQDTVIKDAQDFDVEQRGEQMKGEAFADITSAFSSTRDQGARAMARMGVNPSSGRSQSFNNLSSLAQASEMASAGRQVRAAARAEGYGLTDRASNSLAGYPAMGMQATGAGAGYGAGGLSLANQGLAGMNSGAGQAAGVAGQMGGNATGMYGAQANYKLQSDQQAAANDPFASLLGAGAQLGASAIKWSDRRLKTNITQVGTDERTGLGIYEFEYKNEPGVGWHGVMADEVERFMPAAVQYNADGFASVNYKMIGIELVCLGDNE